MGARTVGSPHPLRRGGVAAAVAVLLAVLVATLLPRAAGVRLASGSDGSDGAVLVPAAASHADVAASCPLAASRSGLCGTVAGFTGWYGSWTTAGVAGAYCLEHAKSQPRPTYAYLKHNTARGLVSAPVESQQRLGYLLATYAGTTDATRAAALAILVHAAEGDTLTTDELHAYSTSLPDAVRQLVLSMWQEAADLHGPYSVGLTVSGSGSTAVGVVTVRSASGHSVPGRTVTWADSPGTQSVTDAAGTARLSIPVVRGTAGGTVTMRATVGNLPKDDFGVWVPSDGTVQSVAVALPTTSAQASGSWTVAPTPGSLQIVKHTDDPSFVRPGGAVFAVVNAAGATVASVTSDQSGHTPEVDALPPGNYQVIEQTPCDGCDLAPPVSVTVVPGRLVGIAVTDHASRHRVTLRKVAPDGSPLAGAVLAVRGQTAPGDVFDVPLGTCTTGADGSCQLPGGNVLAPQVLQVTEVSPAPGTALSSPSVQRADLTTGDATVTFTDPRLTTLGFHKTDTAPGSSVDHAHESLAGAVFAVTAASPAVSPAAPAGSSAGASAAGAPAETSAARSEVTASAEASAASSGASTAPSASGAPASAGAPPAESAPSASAEASPAESAPSPSAAPSPAESPAPDSADPSPAESAAPASAEASPTPVPSAVTGATGAEVARCTTDAAGDCSLPAQSLTEGTTYSWTELVAPPGFARDPAVHRITCGFPCAPQAVTVANEGRYAPVIVVKHERGHADVPVPGAVIDLCARDGLPSTLAGTYVAPPGQVCGSAGTWVASSTTGSDGHGTFGLLPPGGSYCAVERAAPVGWVLDAAPVCGNVAPAGDAAAADLPIATLTLDLAETRAPAPVPTRPATVAATKLQAPVVPTAPRTSRPRPSLRRPAAPQQPLAYTGTQDVAPIALTGGGLVGMGAMAVAGAALLTRRTRRPWTGAGARPVLSGSPDSWGGWVPTPPHT